MGKHRRLQEVLIFSPTLPYPPPSLLLTQLVSEGCPSQLPPRSFSFHKQMENEPETQTYLFCRLRLLLRLRRLFQQRVKVGRRGFHHEPRLFRLQARRRLLLGALGSVQRGRGFGGGPGGGLGCGRTRGNCASRETVFFPPLFYSKRDRLAYKSCCSFL
jgi:hypothetical protein